MLVCRYSKKGNDMNTQEIIKEIRKSGKVAITMGGTEIEVLVDKSDLIEMLKNNESPDADYGIYPRAGQGYRCVFSCTDW